MDNIRPTLESGIRNDRFINELGELLSQNGLEYVEDGAHSYARKKDDPTKQSWLGTTGLLGFDGPKTIEEFKETSEWQRLLEL